MKIILLIVSMLASTSVYAETVPAQQAKKNGVTTCSSFIEDLSKFVVKENDHGSLATWNKNKPDDRLYNALVAVKYTDGNSVAVINAINTKSGKCDGGYTTIFYLDKSCAVARETIFKEWKFYSQLAGLVVLENPSGAVSKVLLPAGAGCVTVSVETAYQ